MVQIIFFKHLIYLNQRLRHCMLFKVIIWLNYLMYWYSKHFLVWGASSIVLFNCCIGLPVHSSHFFFRKYVRNDTLISISISISLLIVCKNRSEHISDSFILFKQTKSVKIKKCIFQHWKYFMDNIGVCRIDIVLVCGLNIEVILI